MLFLNAFPWHSSKVVFVCGSSGFIFLLLLHALIDQIDKIDKAHCLRWIIDPSVNEKVGERIILLETTIVLSVHHRPWSPEAASEVLIIVHSEVFWTELLRLGHIQKVIIIEHLT